MTRGAIKDPVFEADLGEYGYTMGAIGRLCHIKNPLKKSKTQVYPTER